MSAKSRQHVRWFRNSAPYINAHRGRTFVLVFGGDAALHPNFANIIHDIALLNSLGVRLILIHGARPQIPAGILQLVTFLRPGGQIDNFCNGICDADGPLEIGGGASAPCDPLN